MNQNNLIEWKHLEGFIKNIVKLLYWIAGISIICMMLITCVDILLRLSVTLYHRYHIGFLEPLEPIAGTYELVCFMGAVAVAFAMAHTSLEKGHVAVSLIVRLLPIRFQGVIGVITNLFCLILFSLLSWRSIVYGNHLREIHEVSLTLQLPFYPFVYGVGFASAILCLALILDIIKEFSKVVKG